MYQKVLSYDLSLKLASNVSWHATAYYAKVLTDHRVVEWTRKTKHLSAHAFTDKPDRVTRKRDLNIEKF